MALYTLLGAMIFPIHHVHSASHGGIHGSIHSAGHSVHHALTSIGRGVINPLESSGLHVDANVGFSSGTNSTDVHADVSVAYGPDISANVHFDMHNDSTQLDLSVGGGVGTN